jgi:hypothetical protein
MSRLVKRAEEQLQKVTPQAEALTELTTQRHIFSSRKMPFTAGAAAAAAAAKVCARMSVCLFV